MNTTNRSELKQRQGGLVWIEFKGHRRAFYSNPFEFPFRLDDIAIVEADRGEDAGVVRFVALEKNGFASEAPQYAVIRRATSNDHERIESLRDKENEAYDSCLDMIEAHDLPMRLVDAEFRFDGLKLTFFFTADNRVDFRTLVRELAGEFRTRIELRQIGVRDEVKRDDGYGICGRRLCCVSFLNRFQPITTLIAKEQNLILNPTKLSGVCGKLKCCLIFEYANYLPGGDLAGAAQFHSVDSGENSCKDISPK